MIRMDDCQQQSWTLSTLISAYIQLIITWVLLSCSAFFFFISKFLSLLGLSLDSPPCQSILFHFPINSLSSIHLSISSKLPFTHHLSHLHLNLVPQPHFSVAAAESSHDVADFHLDAQPSGNGDTTRRYTLGPSPSPLYIHDVPAQDNALIPVRTVKDDATYERGIESHDEDGVVIVQQDLELERSASAALCAELEQERIAAATAADEAMAMISRLQEEKASVEMEARQYQRILEEKSAYDAEEMSILKEIIVRRETEIHFLEKELEEYRNRFQDCQVEDTQECYDIVESHVDPSSPAIECRDNQESPESCSMVQDDMLFSNSNAIDNVVRGDRMQIMEPHVHDVHIDATKYSSTEKTVDSFVERECDPSSEVEQGINKSCSDMAEKFSSMSSSPSGSLMSLVDQERLRIESEIGYLRARLRAVHEEKEKLKSSLQSQEQGKTELRLLEDIAGLLREIRNLREPEKIARQASLPPLSSKETSKRRRSRNTTVGVAQSSSS